MSEAIRLTVIYPVRDFAEFVRAMGTLERPPDDGVIDQRVYQSLDDPNEVLVELHLDSHAKAMELVKGDGVRDVLERIGAAIYPPVFIGAEVGSLRYER